MNTDSRHSRFRITRAPAAALLVGLLAAATMAGRVEAHSATPAVANSPCIPAGHGPGDIPSISFGRSGNIRPMTVKIYGDGTITYKGITPPIADYAMTPWAVLGLQRLANAEGFSTMPAVDTGTPVQPDMATLFITVRAGCSPATKTVKARSGMPDGFTELYDTLSAAVALGKG